MPAIVEPIFLPNKGIKLDAPEQFLLDQLSPYSRNMRYEDELLQSRNGCVKFSTHVLTDDVLLIDQFKKLSGSQDVLFCATKSIYKYDFSFSRYDILDKLYTTGTIEIQVGTPTIVRGTGTAWASTNVKVNDYFKIGAGNVHTGSTWYKVTAVDYGLQQLTLASAAPTTAAGSAYVVRLTFTGANTDMWHSVQFIDSSLGEVWIATNGKDKPVYWTGTGQVVDVGGLPAGFTACRYLASFFNRVLFGWTVEGGQNQPIRVRWSAAGNSQSYPAANQNDLEEGGFDAWIKGFKAVDDSLIIPKTRGAYVMRPVDTDAVFDFDFHSSFIGAQSAESLIQYESGVYYFGTDSRFHYWNFVRDQEVFREIIPYLETIDPNNSQYVFGKDIKAKDEFRWSLPYNSSDGVSPVVVYNRINNSVQIWDYKLSSWIRCIGDYLNTQDLYVDDPVWGEYFVDTQDGFWDDVTFLSNAPVVVYGNADGIVRKADQGSDDDGVAFTRVVDTKRLDFGKSHMNKRLWKQQWWLRSETSGSVLIRIKRDDSTSFDNQTKTISLINAARDIIKEFVTWDKEFEDAKFRIEATNGFALLGFLNWIYDKRKKAA